MGRVKRHEFKEMFDDPLVDEMVEEVERELDDLPSETDDERTVEPDSDDDNQTENEHEEEDDEDVDYEECKDYLKTLTPQQRLKYASNERLRNLANRLPEDFKMKTVYKVMADLKKEEDDDEDDDDDDDDENSSLFNHMVSVAVENAGYELPDDDASDSPRRSRMDDYS